jgi:hypothetical protein
MAARSKGEEEIWSSGTSRKSWCDRQKPCRFCWDYINVTMKFGGGLKQSCENRPPHLKVARPFGNGRNPGHAKKPPKKSSRKKSEEESISDDPDEGSYNEEGSYFTAKKNKSVLIFL